MGTTLNKMIKGLPKKRRAKVKARAKQLIAEEMTLQDIRRARDLTQEKIAELLHIGQDSVSRLEKRTDLLLSTLQNFVSAIGGELRLIAEFPDRPPVELTGLSGDEPKETHQAGKRSKKSRTDTNTAHRV